ncbi:Hypothetical predicted protein, partial [Pelobates cultripes]
GDGGLVTWLVGRKVASGPVPDVVVVHGGGNDLGLIPQRELLWRMKRDMDRLRELVPGVVVVWSEMVPRFTWRHTRDPAAVARCRGKVNRTMAVFVSRMGGVVVRHRELEGMLPGYFRRDGVHLSDIGLWLTSNHDMRLLCLGGELRAVFILRSEVNSERCES